MFVKQNRCILIVEVLIVVFGILCWLSFIVFCCFCIFNPLLVKLYFIALFFFVCFFQIVVLLCFFKSLHFHPDETKTLLFCIFDPFLCVFCFVFAFSIPFLSYFLGFLFCFCIFNLFFLVFFQIVPFAPRLKNFLVFFSNRCSFTPIKKSTVFLHFQSFVGKTFFYSFVFFLFLSNSCIFTPIKKTTVFCIVNPVFCIVNPLLVKLYFIALFSCFFCIVDSSSGNPVFYSFVSLCSCFFCIMDPFLVTLYFIALFFFVFVSIR